MNETTAAVREAIENVVAAHRGDFDFSIQRWGTHSFSFESDSQLRSVKEETEALLPQYLKMASAAIDDKWRP